MKIKFIYFLALAMGSSLSAMADFKTINVSNDTRYDLIRDNDGTTRQNRLQDRIRIGFVYDFGGNFELVGLVDSGPTYGNDWATVRDFEADEHSLNPQLAFRRLYLRKLFEQQEGRQTEVRLGELEGLDSTGSAGIGSSGWVDGLHVIHRTNALNFSIRVGSISDPTNTNILSRDRKLNFVEMEVSRQFLQRIMVRAGYEHFHDDFLRAALEVDVSVFGREALKFIAQVLYDIDTNALNFDIGARIDILRIFNDSFTDYLRLDVIVSRTDANMNFRNSLYAAYYQDQVSANIGLSGRIDRNGHFRWFMRESTGNHAQRFDAGITIMYQGIH